MESVLERERQAVENEMSEEEREHRRLMSERMRALLSGSDELLPAREEIGAREYTGGFRSEHVPVYQNYTEEHHAPVVPNSPNAPSAARRLADYYVITPGRPMQRFGDMTGVRDYAPAAPTAAPEAPAAPAAHTTTRLFDDLLLRDGTLVRETPADVQANVYAPVREQPYAPAQAPQEAPAYTSYEAAPEAPAQTEEDDDAKPTRRTLLYQNAAEEKNTHLLSALSLRTKLVLAAVAAVVVLLLAIVCVNTAIINSMDRGIAEREAQLSELTRTMDGINGAIDEITSPENVTAWAAAHGMIG